MTTFDPKQGSDWMDPGHSGYTDDQWHAHQGEKQPEHSHGSIAPGTILAIGVIGFLLVVTCIVLITQFFKMTAQKEFDTKTEVPINAEFRSARATWDEKLSGYGWVDGQAGVVHLPLDIAEMKVAKEYASTP